MLRREIEDSDSVQSNSAESLFSTGTIANAQVVAGVSQCHGNYYAMIIISDVAHGCDTHAKSETT